MPVSPKLKVLPSGTLPRTAELEKFRRRKCYQLGSSYDGRQFVTLSVHLCVQHDMCDVMCRAGSSATAEICSVTPDGSL